jgi:hypothetical protein
MCCSYCYNTSILESKTQACYSFWMTCEIASNLDECIRPATVRMRATEKKPKEFEIASHLDVRLAAVVPRSQQRHGTSSQAGRRPESHSNREILDLGWGWTEEEEEWGWTDSNLAAAVSVGQGGKSGLRGKDWRRAGRIEREGKDGAHDR